MKNNKSPGPSGITAEMFKALEQDGIDWLHTILTGFMKKDRLPQDFKNIEKLASYKQKGDVMRCVNYRGIELLEIGLKVYEKVIERRIRERVELRDNQFGFRPERCGGYLESH